MINARGTARLGMLAGHVKVGGTSASIFDSGIDIGNNTESGVGAIAANGSDDIAYADGTDSTASAGGVFGNTIFTSDLASNDDVAVVVDPSGTTGSFAYAGAGGGVPFNSDLPAVSSLTVRASAFMAPTTFTTSCLRWVRVPAPRRLPAGATCWPSCCRCSRVAIRQPWSSVLGPRAAHANPPLAIEGSSFCHSSHICHGDLCLNRHPICPAHSDKLKVPTLSLVGGHFY
jgi:hypothetical protein